MFYYFILFLYSSSLLRLHRICVSQEKNKVPKLKLPRLGKTNIINSTSYWVIWLYAVLQRDHL